MAGEGSRRWIGVPDVAATHQDAQAEACSSHQVGTVSAELAATPKAM